MDRSTTKIKKCINCSGRRFKIVERILTGERSFRIDECMKCGLFFQNPMPSKKFLQSFYHDVYDKKCNLRITENAFDEKDEIQERNRIKEIEKYIKGGKLLDVGASNGFFLSELRNFKEWKGFGVEYSKPAIKEAKKRFRLNVMHGEITDKNMQSNFYDVITMHSVLEHIPNVVENLQAVHKCLKKGGYFIFNVPNTHSFEYYLYRFLHKPFPGFIFEHLYYYNPSVIKNLLNKNQFEIVYMTSRHHSTLRLPPPRPLIGWLTFFPKLFFEYTSIGGALNVGNILYIYAKKKN